MIPSVSPHQTTVILLLSFMALRACACAPFFPPSFLADDPGGRIPSMETQYHFKLLADHFFPDAVMPRRVTREEEPASPRLEYTLFDAGLAEMHQNPAILYPAAWRKLLELPPAERRYRTARTLYLLGNLHLKQSADAAYPFYQRLRREVEGGAPDNQNLARQSYRTNFFYQHDPVQKLKFMILAHRSGYHPKEVYYELAAFRRLLWSNSVPELRHKLMADPMTAEAALLLCPQLSLQTNQCFLLADRVAFGAYLAGNFKLSRNLLRQAPHDSMLRLYLEAKLARREGDDALAAKLLKRWLLLYADQKVKHGPIVFSEENYSRSAGFGRMPLEIESDTTDHTFTEEVYGTLGRVQVNQHDFSEALYSFLRAGSWQDAALTAEQLLSANELKSFISTNLGKGLFPVASENKLRGLYGRQLMRRGAVYEAGEFLPAAVKPHWLRYCSLSKTANDAEVSREVRAKRFFQLGQLLLQNAMDLFGYELYPDFAIWDGRFTNQPDPAKWLGDTLPPLRRFHYHGRIYEAFLRSAMLTESTDLRLAALLLAGLTVRAWDVDMTRYIYALICDLRPDDRAQKIAAYRWIPLPYSKWKNLTVDVDVENPEEIKHLPQHILGNP